MNFFALSGLINGITSTILGVLVFAKGRKDIRNITYVLFVFTVAFWSYFYFLWQIASEKNIALFACRTFMAGAIFIPVTYLHHLTVLVDIYKQKKKIIVYGYLLASFFLILNFTPFFIRSVSQKLIFKFWPNPGIAYHPFFILWVSYVIYGIGLIIAEYKKSRGFRKNQLKYVLLATFIGWTGGATNYPLWYNIPILPLGNIFVSGYIIILAFAIIRYRLMDIKLTVTRSGVFITIYTVILGLPFALGIWGRQWLIEILKAQWWTGPLILMAALATIGPYVYIYLQKKAEGAILKEQRRYQGTLKQAAVGMTRIRDLNKLLNLVVHIVTKTVRISHSAIYLYDPKSDFFMLEAGRNLDNARISSINTSVNKKSTLMVWLQNRREPLVYEEVKRKAEANPNNIIFKELEEQLRSLSASVLIPSFVEDKFVGFLILGDKISGQIYSTEDLEIFLVLASQAALAIENAQFIIEAKVMQEQIAQAEKMATIGTMADGISHQINNRLHALLMIAQDTLDTLNLTDTRNYSPEAKELFKQVKHGLDRIQTNVTQGKEVIEGLLKYSRPSIASFSAVSLDDIINGTLEMIKFKVNLSEIDLHRNYPRDIPKIRASLTQMQEVFFNFIDNSYDAIVERKKTLNEPDYRGKISIAAEVNNSKLEIVFEDNGIGVKKEDKHKVFTPFFTTKVSSRAKRGTGLGLFVIRKIIDEYHQGKIFFESAYAKGTRFILELPLATGEA